MAHGPEDVRAHNTDLCRLRAVSCRFIGVNVVDLHQAPCPLKRSPPGSGGVNRHQRPTWPRQPAQLLTAPAWQGMSVARSVGTLAGRSPGALGLPTLEAPNAHVVGSIRPASDWADSWSRS